MEVKKCKIFLVFLAPKQIIRIFEKENL